MLQRGYDAGVSGATLGETTLNTSNVAPGTFRLVFKLPVDDNILAQPLYVPAVVINGISHNVVYVATMSDTLYALTPTWGCSTVDAQSGCFRKRDPVPIAQFAYSGTGT